MVTEDAPELGLPLPLYPPASSAPQQPPPPGDLSVEAVEAVHHRVLAHAPKPQLDLESLTGRGHLLVTIHIKCPELCLRLRRQPCAVLSYSPSGLRGQSPGDEAEVARLASQDVPPMILSVLVSEPEPGSGLLRSPHGGVELLIVTDTLSDGQRSSK